MVNKMVKRSILVLVIILFISLLYLGFKPYLKAELIGSDKKEVLVFNDYVDEGVKACYGSLFLGCKKKPNIEIINNVNNEKIGEYKIIYKVKYKRKVQELSRTINIKDTTPPNLTVNNTEINACPNATHFNLDYEAIDNYDNDITDKVLEDIQGNTLKLTVKDSSNNITTKEIPINYQDEEKPVITLKGTNPTYLYIGNTYKEAGFEVKDNCSENLAQNVSVTNNININKTGTYYVNYKVKDEFNNEATITRTVKVIANTPSVSKGNKIVYLTFDDGPSYYTNELLDILKEYHVKATFFVTWQSPRYADAIKRAYNEGHSIGLHTYSHVYSKVYSSVDAYFNDLNAIQDKVKSLIGISPTLIRFPGGSSNTVSKITPKIMTVLTGEVTARGYHYFDWNVSSNDTGTTNTSVIANNVIKSLRGGTYIVLQHDTKPSSIRAVKSIIEYGLANGYTFLPLEEDSPTFHHGLNN